MTTKTPPHSLESEIDVLGAILQDQEALDTAVQTLVKDDFYIPKHKLIFEAIYKLHEGSDAVDITTVANALDRKDKLTEIGGRVYLADLLEHAVSTNVDAHCRIVSEKADIRNLITTMTQAIHECYKDDETASKIIDRMESVIMGASLRRGSETFHHVKTIIPDNLDDLDKSLRGEREYINTGYADLDGLVVGLTPSDLIILAGRPAMGKSALAMNIGEKIATTGIPVGVFSLEMSKEQLTKRIQYGMAGVSGKLAEQGKISQPQYDKIKDASDKLSKIPLYIDDSAILTPSTLRSKARRMVSRHDVGVIIIDYIQLMVGKGNNRTEEVGDISRALKLLAKELNVPVIALSQLSRAVESRQDKRPILSDLRESGNIEQDADEVWFVFRGEEYLKHLDKEDPKRTASAGKAEILVRKNRDGETGKVDLTFIPDYARFENASKLTAPDDGLPF